MPNGPIPSILMTSGENLAGRTFLHRVLGGTPMTYQIPLLLPIPAGTVWSNVSDRVRTVSGPCPRDVTVKYGVHKRTGP